eukprot:TRINITY_DN8945_c0_g4_i1.p2 TRINITY_DN8945_c0_g4~~TRINITY_DN8945_c0_g4_i1.p2  ORF type:complete len:270 (-),score=12.92 TRINITY_DN8945_c0_g4_i1:241-1050(-)
MRLPTVANLLRAQRLSWWQVVAKRPEDHVLLLACMFGRLSSDKHPPLDRELKVHRHSHEFVVQLRDDVQALAVTIGSDVLHDCANEPFALFRDGVERDEFLGADARVVANGDFCVAIPPPTTQAASTHEEAQQPAEPEEPAFVCNLRLDNGEVCGRRFETYQKLNMHRIHTKGGEHGQDARSLGNKITLFNQCPMCRAIHASRQSAQRHVNRALENNKCPATRGGSAFSKTVDAQMPAKCLICETECDTLEEFQWHVCSHLPAGFELVL